jgi:enoyl-CoA hydratase/carnithine racemase
MLTGRRIGSREALRYGLVSQIVPPDQLDATVDELAVELADLDPDAVRAVCRAVREGQDLALDAALRLEAHLADSLAPHNPGALA